MSKTHTETGSVKESFITSLCDEITYKQIRPSIANEFETHIDDLAAELIETGIPADTAYDTAVGRMGNPSEIGAELNKTYRPLTEWSVLLLTTALTGIGLFVLLFINNTNNTRFFNNQSLYVSIGIGAASMVAAMLFDYKKLEKISIAAYLAICGIIYLILIISPGYYNRPLVFIAFGPLRLYHIPTLLSPFLIISFAGIVKHFCISKSMSIKTNISFSSQDMPINAKQPYSGTLRGFIIMIALSAMSVFLFMRIPQFSFSLIFGFVLLCMITYGILQKDFPGDRRKYIAGLYGGGFLSITALTAYMIHTHSYLADRLMNFLPNAEKDLLGSGYQSFTASQFLQASKILGEASLNSGGELVTVAKLLPEPHCDYVLITIAATFGLVGVIAVLLLLLLFIWRIAASSKKISDAYGRVLTIGICAAFIFKIAINTMMTFGFLPNMGLALPFISYDWVGIISNMTLVGLLLGVYRRKNLIAEPSTLSLNRFDKHDTTA